MQNNPWRAVTGNGFAARIEKAVKDSVASDGDIQRFIAAFKARKARGG